MACGIWLSHQESNLRWECGHWTSREVPTFHSFFLRIFIYIVSCFLTAESSLAHGLSLAAVSEGCSLLAVHSLLIAVASLVAKGLGLSSRSRAPA